MKQPVLTGQVMAQVKHFKPNMAQVKEAIEGLIEKQYITRAEMDTLIFC